jgi:hypothetical protein
MKLRGVLLTGGTGFIGGHVIRALLAGGAQPWVWSRAPAKARRVLDARVKIVGALADIPESVAIDGIVNLAGAPVIGPPWTQSRRQLLIDSRVKTTEAVIGWCAGRAERPRSLVSASAIGYYGAIEGAESEQWLDESASPRPQFQSELCRLRELATQPAEALGLRVVNLRIGLVLGADGGILARLALAARLGGAAVLGDGQQWMSWIHIDDLVRVIELALEESSLSGPVNAVAPEPVRQREFQRTLTRQLKRPLWLRIPAAPLRWAMGEMSELLIRSQRVSPRRLQDAGFEFRYPALPAALADLLPRTS